MPTPSAQSKMKKRTNLSISEVLLNEAKSLEVNLSQSAEQGISQAIAKAKKEKWLRENTDSLVSSNDFVNQNGLPLARYKQF